jgi:uncharacterized protein YndB with AHSA1/START domain
MDIRPSPPVFILQNFRAPPETVFDAWINPEIVRQWMFASPTNKIEVIRMDPGTGGKFSILEWNGCEHIDHFGEYLVVEPAHRLVFTLEVPKHFPGQTVVNVIIMPLGNGSTMTFSQSGVDREVTTAPWRTMLRNLNTLLVGGPVLFCSRQVRRTNSRLFANTKIAKHDVENLVHFNPARESSQRPGRNP